MGAILKCVERFEANNRNVKQNTGDQKLVSIALTIREVIG